MRTAKVFLDQAFAGLLSEHEEGFTFQYDREYLTSKDAMPVSLTLPLQEAAFTSAVLFPFFDGLIPEGWLLEIAERNWKIDERDRIGWSGRRFPPVST